MNKLLKRIGMLVISGVIAASASVMPTMAAHKETDMVTYDGNKAKKYYYKAAVWNGQVVVSPKGISKSKAISRVKRNLSVYSFTSSMARAIITQAGFYCSSSEIDDKRYRGHIYLWHYHKANAKGHALHTLYMFNGNSYLAPMQMVSDQRKENVNGKD